MPDSESFDAFYARTVWRVTSQMHELAGDDGTADHAIREAYAKAYQQWYQVAAYPDSEGWVLATAKDAFERRRGEGGLAAGTPAPSASDSGTWPGIYRPVAKPGSAGAAGREAAADPESTMARPRQATPGSYGPESGYGPAAGYGTAAGYGPPGGNAPAAGYGLPGGDPAGADRMAAGPAQGADGAWSPGAGRQGRPRGRLTAASPGSRRALLIGGAAAAALLVAGIAYATITGHTSGSATTAGKTAKGAARPQPQMLTAGKTGQRSAIPWSLVGPGWALAEFSTAQPGADGHASGSGAYTTYLVDPEGGKYEIATSSGSAAPQLIAWSGDARTALLGVPAGAAMSYSLLNVAAGQPGSLPLPSGVAAVGFTRPDGLNILAVRQGPVRFRLQRYSLTGALQATLGSLPRRPGESWPGGSCTSGCALSSPDGIADVWGIFGDEMQLLSNAGGVLRKLPVPDSGQPPSCVPLSWWNQNTVLANCAAAGPGDASRLWLVPENGAQPSPLTPATGAGSGEIDGAWLTDGTVYLASSNLRQCQNAPAGQPGTDISRADQAGAGSAVSIPGSTGNASTVVTSDGSRLLVLAQTSCPGTSALLWFNPASGTATTVLTAPASQAGVVAAVPYGNGPTALAADQ